MSGRNDRFNRSMKSLDGMLAGYSDLSKVKILGDGGVSLERLVEAVDYSPLRERRRDSLRAERRLTRRKHRLAALSEAISRLVIAGKGHLVPALLLIVRNGANRSASARMLSERSYRRHRSELCAFFGVDC